MTALPLTASASDSNKWTWEDTGLQIVFSGILAADWAQTLHIARSAKNFYYNPSFNSEAGIGYAYAGTYESGGAERFIGKYPSKRDVNVYFATMLIGHAAVSYLLPKPYRTIWQGSYIIYEYDVVRRNRNLGLGLSLHF